MSRKLTITAGLMLLMTCSTVMAGPVNRFYRTKSTRPVCGCVESQTASSRSLTLSTPGVPQGQHTVKRRGPVNRFRPSGRTVAPAKPPAFIADWWHNVIRR